MTDLVAGMYEVGAIMARSSRKGARMPAAMLLILNLLMLLRPNVSK